MTTERFPGVIVAGGQSRRMGGGDKFLLPLGGKPIIARIIERFGRQASPLAINANGDPGRISDFGLPVIPDTFEGFAGPLAGVLAAMNWAAEVAPQASHVATCAADTPFFPEDYVAVLRDKAGPETIVLATSDGNRHPVFGLWPVALAGDLAAWLAGTDTYKVLAWVNRHEKAFADFALYRMGGETIDPFFNINTPEDLDTATRLAEARVT